MKTTRKQNFYHFAALLTSGAALTIVFYRLIASMTGAGSGVFLMLCGFPVLVAGVLLAVRYRREIRRNPRSLLAAAGAGAVGFCLVTLPEDLGMSDRLLHSMSFGAFFVGIFVWLLFISFAWTFVPWVYRHALGALTSWRRE